MARDYSVPRKTNDSLIAQLRLERGMTQAQLAKAIGSQPSRIHEWETGIRKPKLENLMKIGAVLGVDWTTLIIR